MNLVEFVTERTETIAPHIRITILDKHIRFRADGFGRFGGTAVGKCPYPHARIFGGDSFGDLIDECQQQAAIAFGIGNFFAGRTQTHETGLIHLGYIIYHRRIDRIFQPVAPDEFTEGVDYDFYRLRIGHTEVSALRVAVKAFAMLIHTEKFRMFGEIFLRRQIAVKIVINIHQG